MIVKNEEALLTRCLDSYQHLYDELIIVDTGSIDRTKEIAAEYTDKIYDYAWNGDFSAARNFAFSKATCDYILSADADELLDLKNQQAFLSLKEVLLPEIDIVQMKYINSKEFNTVYNAQVEYRPKLFKRLRTFQWISPIHETIRLEPIVFDSDIEILHKPQSSHTQRDLDTVANAIRHGVHLENYVLIMLCKELFISGTDKDFLSLSELFKNSIVGAYNDEDCKRNIDCVLARIYRLENDYNNFFKLCLKTVATNPCAEIFMELGLYFQEQKDYEEAILWYINALSEAPSIIDIHSSGDLPLFQLSACYHELSKQAKQNNEVELSECYAENATNYEVQAKTWKLPTHLND
jgi:glycosyltransferase involved in cell wall biosynthesis